MSQLTIPQALLGWSGEQYSGGDTTYERHEIVSDGETEFGDDDLDPRSGHGSGTDLDDERDANAWSHDPPHVLEIEGKNGSFIDAFDSDDQYNANELLTTKDSVPANKRHTYRHEKYGHFSSVHEDTWDNVIDWDGAMSRGDNDRSDRELANDWIRVTEMFGRRLDLPDRVIGDAASIVRGIDGRSLSARMEPVCLVALAIAHQRAFEWDRLYLLKTDDSEYWTDHYIDDEFDRERRRPSPLGSWREFKYLLSRFECDRDTVISLADRMRARAEIPRETIDSMKSLIAKYPDSHNSYSSYPA